MIHLAGLQEMDSNVVIEHPNFINGEDLEFIDNSVLSNLFPWYWGDRQTTKGFPLLGHTLLSRDGDEPNSEVFDFFVGLLKKFCGVHGISIERILRGSLNLTYNFNEAHGDPHVDYSFDVHQCIMYLNTCDSGETILFKEEYGKDGYVEDIYEVSGDKKFTHKLKVSPVKGKVLYFYGKNYHTHAWCSQGQRRVICVFCFV